MGCSYKVTNRAAGQLDSGWFGFGFCGKMGGPSERLFMWGSSYEHLDFSWFRGLTLWQKIKKKIKS